MQQNENIEVSYINKIIDIDYTNKQKQSQLRLFHKFLLPLFKKYKAKKILDVGCGIGMTVKLSRIFGFESYGIDLPNYTSIWESFYENTDYLLGGNALNLPFENDTFDVVYSFGVIEHIGTTNGHDELRNDYFDQRKIFANEILRVTKPNGKIIISCPNKNFPIDLQHGEKIHKTFGKFFLLSYGDINKVFIKAKKIEALPLNNFLGFISFNNFYKKIILFFIKLYLFIIPKFARKTFLNPYILVEITKDEKK